MVLSRLQGLPWREGEADGARLQSFRFGSWTSGTIPA